MTGHRPDQPGTQDPSDSESQNAGADVSADEFAAALKLIVKRLEGQDDGAETPPLGSDSEGVSAAVPTTAALDSAPEPAAKDPLWTGLSDSPGAGACAVTVRFTFAIGGRIRCRLALGRHSPIRPKAGPAAAQPRQQIYGRRHRQNPKTRHLRPNPQRSPMTRCSPRQPVPAKIPCSPNHRRAPLRNRKIRCSPRRPVPAKSPCSQNRRPSPPRNRKIRCSPTRPDQARNHCSRNRHLSPSQKPIRCSAIRPMG